MAARTYNLHRVTDRTRSRDVRRSMELTRKAEEEGADAFQRGLPSTANPHTVGDKMVGWRRGYADARAAAPYLERKIS